MQFSVTLSILERNTRPSLMPFVVVLYVNNMSFYKDTLYDTNSKTVL